MAAIRKIAEHSDFAFVSVAGFNYVTRRISPAFTWIPHALVPELGESTR